jgi:hypothetical protein
MAFQDNLLVRLHKWAIRQDENFLTETFAYLLEYLAENEPEAAAEIVARITGRIITLSPHHMRVLDVQTQIGGEEGITDIELRTGQHFVIIEVKIEAQATEEQLRWYRRRLDHSPVTLKGLVLLTRYPAVMVAGADHYLRWYEVAELIGLESSRYQFKATSQFLVDQFLGFLKARNMTMGQVTWEMTTGVRSLRNLVEMLYEAAAACDVRAEIRGHSEAIQVFLDGRKYIAEIRYNAPELLRFGTSSAPVDPRKVEELGIGTTWQWRDDRTKVGWERDINLESEDVHFFARSKASQMQFLEQFLRENLEYAKKVVVTETGGNQSSPEPLTDDER